MGVNKVDRNESRAQSTSSMSVFVALQRKNNVSIDVLIVHQSIGSTSVIRTDLTCTPPAPDAHAHTHTRNLFDVLPCIINVHKNHHVN